MNRIRTHKFLVNEDNGVCARLDEYTEKGNTIYAVYTIGPHVRNKKNFKKFHEFSDVEQNHSTRR